MAVSGSFVRTKVVWTLVWSLSFVQFELLFSLVSGFSRAACAHGVGIWCREGGGCAHEWCPRFVSTALFRRYIYFSASGPLLSDCGCIHKFEVHFLPPLYTITCKEYRYLYSLRVYTPYSTYTPDSCKWVLHTICVLWERMWEARAANTGVPQSCL